MDTAKRRILKGPLFGEIARFGAPLALGMFLQNLFNLVDAYLVAHLPAAEVGPAIGALGICDQIAALGTILSYGVTTATSALLSNQTGSGDERAVQRTAYQSTLIVLAMSAVFGILGIAFAGTVVRDVIGAKGDVAARATPYLRVVVGGSFSIFFLLHFTGIQRSLGSAKTPATLLVLGNALNVALAGVLMFGGGEAGPAPTGLGWAAGVARALHIPPLGLLGAAWATIAARSLVLLPNVVLLGRRFKVALPPKGERGPDWTELRRILSLAWPASAQFVVRISGMLFVSSVVARYYTTVEDQTAQAALGLVFRLDTLALFIAMGWGSAAQTFVGQNLGAGHVKRAGRSGWVTVGYDAVTNVLLVLALLTWGAAVLRAFAGNEAQVTIAARYLAIVAPSYLGLGVAVVLGNAMQGAGAARTTLGLDLLVIVGLQVPLSLLAVGVWGVPIEGLFQCVAAANAAGAIVYGVVYVRGGWQRALARVQ